MKRLGISNMDEVQGMTWHISNRSLLTLIGTGRVATKRGTFNSGID
jgi:hypothetical protein